MLKMAVAAADVAGVRETIVWKARVVVTSVSSAYPVWVEAQDKGGPALR
jgi:hypothetical protein